MDFCGFEKLYIVKILNYEKSFFKPRQRDRTTGVLWSTSLYSNLHNPMMTLSYYFVDREFSDDCQSGAHSKVARTTPFLVLVCPRLSFILESLPFQPYEAFSNTHHVFWDSERLTGRCILYLHRFIFIFRFRL